MKRLPVVLTAALFVVAMVSSSALAKSEKVEKKAKEGEISIKGFLSIVKDDKGGVTDTTITAKNGTVYSIEKAGLVQDVSAMDGKEVEAKGAVKELEGKMMLAVKGEIKAVVEKKASKPRKEGKK